MNNLRTKHLLILIFLSVVFFILGNHILPITSPDEVFYVQTAKEMVDHGSWLTPYLFGQSQFEKPIFIYWIMRLEFILLGDSNFSTRLVFSLFGVIGVICVYFLGLIGFKDEKKAFISSLVLASSALYVGICRIVLTDMVFSVFILLALIFFIRGYLRRTQGGIICFFVFSAFAVLTKGPLGIILPFITIVFFLLLARDLKYLFCRSFLWGIIYFSIISLPWYVLIIHKHGFSFINEFFYNDHLRRLIEAEHNNDTWYYYLFLLLVGTFPWSVFAFVGLRRLIANIKNSNPIYLFLACWVGVVFCIFQVAHSKLMHYIFPAYPAIALAIGDFIKDSLNKKGKILPWAFIVSVFIISVISLWMSLASLVNLKDIISRVNIYLLVSGSFLFTIVSFLMIIKSKYERLFYIFVFICPLILFWIFSSANSLKPYISTADACSVLDGTKDVNNTLLVSKYFARDVRHNTGKDVAVFDLKGKNFFSPHPIPFLDSYLKLVDFLSGQKVTYCILNKYSAKKIGYIKEMGFKIKLINVIADKYILMIDRPINLKPAI